MLAERWDAAGTALRETRRDTYAALLTAQRDERAGGSVPRWVDRQAIPTGTKSRNGEPLNSPGADRLPITLQPPARERAERLAGFGMTGRIGRHEQKRSSAYSAFLPQKAVPVHRAAAECVVAAEIKVKRRRRDPLRRQAPATGGRVATSRQREAEIWLRFGFRFANVELALTREQRRAAREALLMEQSHALAAIRMLDAAERMAATAVTQQAKNNDTSLRTNSLTMEKQYIQKPQRFRLRRHGHLPKFFLAWNI